MATKKVDLGGLGDYDIVPPKAVAASGALTAFYNKLGRPQDPLSPAGEQMMKFIIAAWEDLYPEQVKVHKERVKDYQDSEMSSMEQVTKHTGRSLASIPTPVYRMMSKIFPDFKLDSRENFLKLTKKYPIFQMANKI